MGSDSPRNSGSKAASAGSPVYLEDISRHGAQESLYQALIAARLWGVLGSEAIPLDENASGRVTAAPIWARMSSPNYHAAAMDGFAVRAEATLGALPSAPITIAVRTAAGYPDSEFATYVDTGDPLPEWADAVVPIENVESVDDRGHATADLRAPAAVRIRASIAPWSHVRPMGEDIVATQLVLPAGHVLGPADLGAIAAAGHDRITVARKPRVAIVPTGSELTPVGSPPGPAGIIEYNSIVLAAQINSMGGAATRFPIVRDDLEMISRAVLRAAEDHDLVLLNAGSSAGAEDFSAAVVSKLGTVLVHGVAVRPGHPVILGLLRPDSGGQYPSRPIIGVPGYPVSASLTVEIFVEPLLATWLGRSSWARPTEHAELTRKITSPPGDEDYVRVAVGRVGGKLLAAPLASGAGVITSLVHADGIVVIPPGIQGVEAGERVSVRLHRTIPEFDQTIFCVGSHDVTLDLLAQFLARSGRRFVSANVGSQGGLLALRRRHAHLAGSHLLDPQGAEYNIPFIRQYMPDIPVKVFAFALRDQGLVVRAGNPKGLTRLEDLARPDVLYVNRQRGAGTRVLLDYHLTRLGILPDSIRGYGQEEYTHLAVAAAVAGDRADCGMGIAAAARALGLDFVPLFKERYDLVIPREHADGDLLAPLIALLGAGEFRDEVARLPGYDVSVMGTVVLED
ncbi:MAG: molybdopterin biosynthesis protein [Chloroflexota bacterium]